MDNVKMNSRQFKIGAIISYLTIVFNIISGLIYTPWLLKAIGDDDYAIYTVATSLIAIFMVDFGINGALSKLISDYVTDGKTEQVDKLMGIVYRLYGIIDFAIFLILIIVYFKLSFIYSKYDASMLLKMRKVYAIIGTYSLLQFPFAGLDGLLISYEKFIVSKGIQLLQKVAVIVAMVVAVNIGGGLYELVIINAATGIIAVFLRLFYIRFSLQVRPLLLYWDQTIVKDILTYSIWMTIISIVNRIYYTLAPSVIAKYQTSIDVNMFSFASIIENYAWTIGTAIYGMFITKITLASKQEDADEKMLFIMERNGQYQLLLLGLLLCGWVAIGKEFINLLWLGKEYEAVYVYTIILLIPDLFYIPQQVGETILIVQDKLRYQAAACILSAVVYAFIMIPFIKAWGVYGVCIAIAVSFIIRQLILNWFYVKKTTLRMRRFYQQVYLKSLPCQIMVLIVAIILNKVIITDHIMILLFKGAFITLIYVVLAILFCISKEEKILILQTLRRWG